MTQLQVFKTAFIALIVIFVLCIGYAFTKGSDTKRLEITEEHILEEDGKHYLLIEDRKLKISEASFQRIELDENREYTISYSYNKLIPKKGRVENISL
ncbi:hypothetical protein D1B33_13335 [Lysinibacillus yapensis]|uniref:Uncharacterized protein n=1 Tax=Ureibacillus yapensis TaxID=2304605 RepID=A0A396S6L2_9BACL|nr:hypothetical protein [Lysinibacillus yapensis]RHW35021.1 hypothetical protein D1B33_13335 [Lysinibacillus yapensis]